VALSGARRIHFVTRPSPSLPRSALELQDEWDTLPTEVEAPRYGASVRPRPRTARGRARSVPRAADARTLPHHDLAFRQEARPCRRFCDHGLPLLEEAAPYVMKALGAPALGLAPYAAKLARRLRRSAGTRGVAAKKHPPTEDLDIGNDRVSVADHGAPAHSARRHRDAIPVRDIPRRWRSHVLRGFRLRRPHVLVTSSAAGRREVGPWTTPFGVALSTAMPSSLASGLGDPFRTSQAARRRGARRVLQAPHTARDLYHDRPPPEQDHHAGGGTTTAARGPAALAANATDRREEPG
jgi:hypothetical protein